MKLSHVLSRTTSSESLTVRKHTPWIASPLEERPHSNGESWDNTPPHESKQLHQGGRPVHLHLPLPHHKDPSLPPFKHHKESSTVELFYDLFFVANLATFTVNHEITDAASLKNYIGFFTILWFTWLETSLFDVRFATDSVWNRFCKAVSFGVMTGFAITGAIYDTSNVAENLKAFRALSLILLVSRLALVAQYGVVLWYVRSYKKTFLPLVATMASLFIAAMIFLGTFWGFDDDDVPGSFPIEEQGGSEGGHTYVAYYVVVCVEAAAIIAISCSWRVVSFKYTHLVERIGLLTLIIMGEGIIGMTKSVSKILQNSASTSGNDIGVIISSVLLIYFIWVLYFDQIEHDRFGTIRQQIWAILHFPLHVAILLTVEGSTALILWNIISHVNSIWVSWFPVNFDFSEIPKYYTGPTDLVHWIEQGINATAAEFKPGALEEAYDYTVNFTSIENLKAEFGTDEWNEQAGEIITDMWTAIQNFIFENFGIEVETKQGGNTSKQELEKNDQYFEVFWTVFLYFYIAAGLFLVTLAVMYWFGKTRKTRGEWGSIGVRTFAGAGITMTTVGLWYGPSGAMLGFLYSPWPIPVVMLSYFVVVVADNLLVWHGNKTIAKQTSSGRKGSVALRQGSAEYRNVPEGESV